MDEKDGRSDRTVERNEKTNEWPSIRRVLLTTTKNLQQRNQKMTDLLILYKLIVRILQGFLS